MPRRQIRLALLALAAAVTVVPACSTTKAPQQTTTAPSTASAPPQSHGVYEQCLTQHGVPSPAAGPPPGSQPRATGPASRTGRPHHGHHATAAARRGPNDLGQRAKRLRVAAAEPPDDGALS